MGILKKPPAVASDAFKSAKWDELTEGRSFAPSDAPTLALLCQWHKVMQQAMDELDSFGGQTAYTNDMGDIKTFPQVNTMKVCSGEIRQLNKQLGIADAHDEGVGHGASSSVLSIVQGRRADRLSATS